MAESHLSCCGPCETYSALVDRLSGASSIYFKAVVDLMFLAGKQKAAQFTEAKQNCEICLKNCNRIAAAVRSHKAAHRC